MSEESLDLSRGVVAVVDDDQATCDAIQRLLRSHGVESQAFASAAACMASGHMDQFSCLILDIRMPGISGLEFQESLLKADVLIPVIYITGYVDDVIRAGSRKAGTIEVLEKPFDADLLMAHVKAAVRIFKGSVRPKTDRRHSVRTLYSAKP